MAAPAAPVITGRTAGAGAHTLRWDAVADAATYKTYRDGVLVSTVTAIAGRNQAQVPCGPLDSLTVTALNAGLEESVASNAIVLPASMGSMTSFGLDAPPFDNSR